MTEPMKTITWTPEILRHFKSAYHACKGDTFWFDKHEFVKDYAKYLIEYLDERLK